MTSGTISLLKFSLINLDERLIPEFSFNKNRILLDYFKSILILTDPL